MSNLTANSLMIRIWIEGLPNRAQIDIIKLFDTVEKRRSNLQTQLEVLTKCECMAMFGYKFKECRGCQNKQLIKGKE